MAGNLLIRADAGIKIGTGHIMRCLALAQAWQTQGGQVTFLSHCKNEFLRNWISREGFQFGHMEHVHPHPDDLKQIAEQIKNYGSGKDRLWLVLDGYQFGPEYQKSLCEVGCRLLVIDDCNHLPEYFANILLNQNIGAEQLDYRCNNHTFQLLGTPYVLLRREFMAWRGWERRIAEVGKKILITMGGADADNITRKAITVMQKIQLKGIEATVVVGAKNPHIDSIKSVCRNSAFPIHLVKDAQNMAELMAWADICISGAGSTSWELAFMGLPQINIVLAANQQMIADHLAKHQLALSVGWHNRMNGDAILNGLQELLLNPEQRKSMGESARRLVDGQGTTRVLASMTDLDQSAQLSDRLNLRHASMADAELLWGWANDPEVRSNSFNHKLISISDHTEWFKDKLASSNTLIFILQIDETPVAQIRYESTNKQYANISFSVAAEYRGRGLGEKTLVLSAKRACRELGVKCIRGSVLDHNLASKKTFLKAGFRRIGRDTIFNTKHDVFECKCP